MPPTRAERLAEIYERHRKELVSFATRLVLRSPVAEDLVQEAALRLVQDDTLPVDDDDVRAWLFRVVTNLGIDHLRRHPTQKELGLLDIRNRAEADGGFLRESRDMRGSPETRAIAREHLIACFSCTLRNLPPQQAVSLLMKEVYGFSVPEVAVVLNATYPQVKNWIQGARRDLAARYSTTCSLIAKEGVCYQCVELDQFFNGTTTDPLDGSARDLDARLAILREHRTSPTGPWHAKMMELVRDAIT